MTSRSDPPGEKRPYCVIPIRAVKDKSMTHNVRRTLEALGHYANRAGVCWPAIRTLVDDTGMGANTVQDAIKALEKAGYIRQLNPNDYDQKAGKWGHSNRYQILWRGNDPVPTWEQVRDANLLQPIPDQVPPDTEGSGVRGTVVQISNHATQLAAAWAAAIERETGVRPGQMPPVADLAVLVDAGVPPGALAAETAVLIRERAAVRMGTPPFSLISKRLLATYKSQTVG
jgi:hypothetical protein